MDSTQGHAHDDSDAASDGRTDDRPSGARSAVADDAERTAYLLVARALELPPSERAGFLSESIARGTLDAASASALERARVLLGRCAEVEQVDAGDRGQAESSSAAEDDARGPGGAGLSIRLGADGLGWVAAADEAAFGGLPRLSAGVRLGPFAITRFVARGGMGEVYEALDTRVDRRVAVKVLPAFASAARIERFAREARLMARVDHPAIARLYEWGTATIADAGGAPLSYIAMEFIDGAPLGETAARLRAAASGDARGIVELLLPVVDAVAHAHARGVLHRDIKPSNILVEPSGKARLLDFGVAALVDPEEQVAFSATGDIGKPGTLAYMSPEQVRGGNARVTTASDVHALGLVLAECLTGERVVVTEGKGLAEVVEQVLSREAPSLARLGRPLEFVVHRALRKDPATRQSSAAALAEDLRRVLAGEQPSGRRLGAIEAVSAFAARNRRALAAGALATAAVATLVGFAAVQFVRAREAEARAEVFIGQLLEGSQPILLDLHLKLIAENQPLAARMAALEATVAYLEWVQANAKDDVRVLAEIARRYRSLATVAGSTGQASLGDGKTATKYYLRSLAILDALIDGSAGGGVDRRLGDEFRSAVLLDRSDVLRDYAGQLPYAERAAYYTRATADQRAAMLLMPAGPKRDGTERYLLFTEVQAARLAGDEAAFEAPLARMRAMAGEPRLAENADFLSELGIAEYLLVQLLERRGAFDEAVTHARASKAALERSIALGLDEFTNNRHLARADFVIASRTCRDRPPAASMDLLLSALERSRAATNLTPESSFNRLSHLESINMFALAARVVAEHARDAGDPEGAARAVERALAAIDRDLAFAQSLPIEGAPHRGEPSVLEELAVARVALAEAAKGG